MKATRTRYFAMYPAHFRAYWLNGNMRWEVIRNANGDPIAYKTREAAEQAAYEKLNEEAETSA